MFSTVIQYRNFDKIITLEISMLNVPFIDVMKEGKVFAIVEDNK